MKISGVKVQRAAKIRKVKGDKVRWSVNELEKETKNVGESMY